MKGKGLVLVIDALQPYGAERVALDLACAFAGMTNVTVVTCKGDAASNLSFVPRGVAHIQIGYGSRPLLRDAVAAVELVRIFRRIRPAAAIGFMPLANMLATFASTFTGTPVIVTEHNVMSAARYGAAKWPATRVAMKWYLRRADAIVGVSEAVSTDLASSFGAPRDRLNTIYNPVDRDRLVQSARRGIRLVRPRTPGEVRIVIVGRLKPAKGHDCALRALTLLPSSYHLDIVGDGQLLQSLQDQADLLGIRARVNFAGWQADSAAWLQAADVVWVPSRFEGFGLVLAESAMLGRRAIATTAPGLFEIARHLQVPTVNPDDPLALAGATTTVMESPPPQRVPWLATLAPDVVAQNYLSLVERVAGRGVSRQPRRQKTPST